MNRLRSKSATALWNGFGAPLRGTVCAVQWTPMPYWHLASQSVLALVYGLFSSPPQSPRTANENEAAVAAADPMNSLLFMVSSTSQPTPTWQSPSVHGTANRPAHRSCVENAPTAALYRRHPAATLWLLTIWPGYPGADAGAPGSTGSRPPVTTPSAHFVSRRHACRRGDPGYAVLDWIGLENLL